MHTHCMHMHTHPCASVPEQVQTSYAGGGKRDSTFDPSLAKSLQAPIARGREASREREREAGLEREGQGQGTREMGRGVEGETGIANAGGREKEIEGEIELVRDGGKEGGKEGGVVREREFACETQNCT